MRYLLSFIELRAPNAATFDGRLLDALRRQISEAEKYSLRFVSMKMGHWAFMLVLALFMALRHTAAGLSVARTARARGKGGGHLCAN